MSQTHPAMAVAELQRRFPGVRVWFGGVTGQWWAMLGNSLIDADDSEELGRRIGAALDTDSHPARSAAHPAGGPDGSWTGAPARSTPPAPQVSRVGVPSPLPWWQWEPAVSHRHRGPTP